jgi:A/G-specific adenine glycosylase
MAGGACYDHNRMLGSETTFGRRLLRWYDACRRELPWRVPRGTRGRVDPYHVLVSETMLQQTQVATVIPYFHRFIERFPTIQSLAEAQEQEVLRLWQGLGYYSRARNLLAAAARVHQHHGGQMPTELDKLLDLPGVGRYTAGAMASIAFDVRAPILDGNVVRVLCRLDRFESDPKRSASREQLWRRAEEIIPNKRAGDFNSALMELGATVCMPRTPYCLICPVRDHCAGAAAGVQATLPIRSKAKPTPLVHRWVYCIRFGDKWLFQQRPRDGRWGGMWQFMTIQSNDPLSLPVAIKYAKRIGEVRHVLTHRRYVFDVWMADAVGSLKKSETRQWLPLAQIGKLPLPRPHLKIAELLRSIIASPVA